MNRLVLAFAAALSITACSPGGAAVDPKDPWNTLQPWNHTRAGVQKLPSGVEYYVIKAGDAKGTAPTPRDTVEVKYEGHLAESGLVFDSSYTRNENAKFGVSRVIPGWTQGLQKMHPGDEIMFWIPSKEAYGERGAGSRIPPNSDLMFQVELVKVIPDPWNKAQPWPTDAANIVRRPSGVEYFPVESGAADGATPTDADEVIVNFEGRLEGVKKETGESDDDVRRRSVVASTFDEGQPKFFPVKDLVAGWAETLKLMRKGDHWMVRIPASQLYQGEGDGRIPPDATVIYEIEMLDFQPAQAAGPQGGPVPAEDPQPQQ